MFCPKCSSEAARGQRYCRNCGIDLGLIWDAVENKPANPLDFERLKKDLREFGSSLRSGFEEAGKGIKNTRRLSQQPGSNQAAGNVQPPNWMREFNKALRKVKAANTRKYSLQQATLSIFSGSAMLIAWNYLLDKAYSSGLLESLEQVLIQRLDLPIAGLAPVFRLLWVIALIPIARGIGHLINGIFFTPEKLEESAEQSVAPQQFIYTSPVYSTEPEVNRNREQQKSVTEDETLRFEPRS